jgi:hypothetical protein
MAGCDRAAGRVKASFFPAITDSLQTEHASVSREVRFVDRRPAVTQLPKTILEKLRSEKPPVQ